METPNSPVETPGRLKPRFLSALAASLVGAALTTSVFAQAVSSSGPLLVAGPSDPNLDLDPNTGVFVLAEFYGTPPQSSYTVSNLTFTLNNARMGNVNFSYMNPPNLGSDPDSQNLAQIAESAAWAGSGNINFTVPTFVGHTMELQLIFYDNWFTTGGNRNFNILINGVTMDANVDIGALGAPRGGTHVLVFRYTFTATTNSLAVQLQRGTADNPCIDGLLLKDTSAATMPPGIVLNTSSITNFTGRTVTITPLVVGVAPISYQWKAGAVGSGSYTNLPGQTGWTLTLNNLSLANAGDYVCTAWNVNGSATSSPVTLRVLQNPNPPIIAGNNFPYALMAYNPLAYWRFSDLPGSPYIYDATTNALDLAPLPNAVLGAAGPKAPAYPGFENNDTALNVPGNGTANDWVQGPAALHLDQWTTNNFTILAWINPATNQPKGAAIVLSRGGNAPDIGGLVYNTYPMADGDMELGWMVDAQDYNVRSGLEVPHNIWSLVAVVITPTNGTLYICNTNGIRSYTQATIHTQNQNPPTPTFTMNGPIYIGHDTFDPSRTFNGLIDEAAVLPIALSTDQMASLFAASKGLAGLPPQVSLQPKGGMVGLGATKVLSPAVSGSLPLTYRWQEQDPASGNYTNLIDSAVYAGSQTTALAISNFNASLAGKYRLVVANAIGSCTSSVATLVLNTIVIDNSYACAVYTNNPYAYWRFNEPAGSGIVFDSSPAGGFDGKPLQYATLGVAGPQPPDFPGLETSNTGLQTQQPGTYPTHPDSSYAMMPQLGLVNVNNVTITLWVNPNNTQQQDRTGLVFLGGTGDGGLNYSDTYTDNAGNPCLGYKWNGGNGGWNTGLVPPAGMWSFIALVVTPNDAMMYMCNTNGISTSRIVIKNQGTSFFQACVVGTDQFYPWDRWNGIFDGTIDEVAIFNKALDGGTVSTLYAKGAGITSMPAVILGQPLSAATVPGGTVQFQANVIGVGLTYQWMVGTNGVFVPILGATSATLTITNASAANVAQYELVVTSPSAPAVTTAPATLYLITAAPPRLIGQWLTGAEDYADKSGYTAAGTHDGIQYGGGTPQWQAGIVPPGFSGSSLWLDGNSTLKIQNSANTDPGYHPTFDYSIAHRFSIAFWAQGFPPNGWHPLVTKGGENGLGWQVRSSPNNSGQVPTFTLRGARNDDANNGAPLNINNGGWHHYAATWDSSTGIRHLYVDGVPGINLGGDFGITTNAASDVHVMAVDATHHLELGAIEANSSDPNYFNGNLFDVRMYNYALSAGEVQALLNPPAAGAVGLYLDSTNAIIAGQSETLTVLIPNGSNKTQPVTVTVTDNTPNVATIEGASGNVLTVVFPAGAPTFQHFVLDAVAAGQLQLAAVANSGVASATLAGSVIAPQCIGQWISGAADLTDKSGFKPGVHDAAATKISVGDATPVFVNGDVPQGYTGSSLKLDGTYLVAIKNSSSLNWDGNYQPTFDTEVLDGFSFSFWAKGTSLPDWQAWFGKFGERSAGWKVRLHGGDHCPTFTMRMCNGNWGTEDPFNSSTRTDGSYGQTWHHYTATFDGKAGTRKLYVDGKLDITVPNMVNYGLAQLDYLTIGGLDGNNNGTSPSFGGYVTGSMFDVRMYNYPLNGSEAQELAHPSTAALLAVADSPVIDLGHSGTVSVSLPAGANASQSVTVWVTNVNPARVSIAGASGNVFPIVFAATARASQSLTLIGLSDGQAQIGFSASGLASASVTVKVLAPARLLGHWFAGHTNLADHAAFSPAGTHDGQIVGTAANLTYSPDVPAGFGGSSVNFNNAGNETTVAVLVTNTCRHDNGYAPTFDDAIAYKFSITFWAKMNAQYGHDWVPFITKRGEDNMSFQVRRAGNSSSETFTLRGTYLNQANDDPFGSANINVANQWHHIAAVWDGYSGTRQVYVDGVLDPSINLANDFGPFMMAENHHLVIGARENGQILGPGITEGLDGGEGFNGLLYDMRFYNYPLSTAEVQTVMTPVKISVLTPPSGEMQLSWPVVSTIGYVLQTSSDLVHWTTSPLTVSTAAGQNTVTDTTAGGMRFYRLFLP